MEMIMKAIGFVIANADLLLQILTGSLGVVMMIAMLIPGDQPEKTLKKIIDVIGKFSRKKKEVNEVATEEVK